MKRKLKGVLGIGLAFMLVVSLMAFAAPVAAADYEENDWGEWGLAAIEPGTDVGPMAIAPDGTIFAAVGPTSYTASLEHTGSATAEWSTTQKHSGTDSARLGLTVLTNEAKVKIPTTGLTLGQISTFSYWYYADSTATASMYEGFIKEETFAEPSGGGYAAYSTYGAPYLVIELDTDLNGAADTWVVQAKFAAKYNQTWKQDTIEATEPFHVAGVAATTPAFSLGTNWGTLAEIKAAVPSLAPTKTLADAAVLKVKVAIGDWGATSPPNLPVVSYIDDVTINGLTYDLEDGEALIPLGSVLSKSEDDGYTWDDTELVDAAAPIVDIAISSNYEEDETVYVGCADGTVYRVEEAGEGDVIALKDIVDSEGTTASQLFSMDVWTDEGDYNWILVGTNLDVLVLKDKTFEDWRDQELATGGDTWVAYEVAFAPDFEDSDLIWAVIDDAKNHPVGADFMVTATASPGKWGQDIGEVDLDIDASPFADIGFPDDYDSDPDSGDTNLWVAVSSPDTGDIFLIEGVDADDGDSNAISMFVDIGGETATDFASIAVSGDYGDEVILAGELDLPTVWISDDGGYGWDEVDKNPTGESMTHVIMGADVVWDGEVFDTDEGMAFASTFGAESAVSRANDGGQVYNQVGLIDTEIDAILDLGFHPDFPDTSTYLMITEDTGYSLWLTENGDEDEPDYVRVLCGYDGGAPGNLDGEFSLVEYSQDADAIYIWGEEDDDSSIWKSTDDGQTFGKQRSVKDDAQINDWVITEDDTIYAATDKDGFYKTTNSGLSWSATTVGSAMNDIALSPDFDSDETILLGSTTGGKVFMSDDEGDSFDDTTTTGLDGNVFVAFSPEYTDDALIYAADDSNNAIKVGEVADTDDVDWDDLEDDANEEPVTGNFFGLAVSSDNALYAIADTASYEGDADDVGEFTGETGVVRLLLDEDDSLWESQADDDLTGPEGLWLSAGSNVLWTINDIAADELWVLEDTCSGQVTLDSPSDGYRHDREDVIQIAWDEMRGADEYEYSLDETTGLVVDESGDDEGTTDDTSINVDVGGSAEYDWKVRVAPGEPWHSRWSDTRTFHTALGAPPWAPELYAPGNGDDDVLLTPAFSWSTAKTADSYQFMLAADSGFTDVLVNEKVSTEAYTPDVTLDYSTTYYWKVYAIKGTKAISRWSEVSVFTTISKAVAPPTPAPPATVTQPAPAQVIIPTPIPPVLLWVIVGIGAALIIAVIVLIVRTRRAI